MRHTCNPITPYPETSNAEPPRRHAGLSKYGDNSLVVSITGIPSPQRSCKRGKFPNILLKAFECAPWAPLPQEYTGQSIPHVKSCLKVAEFHFLDGQMVPPTHSDSPEVTFSQGSKALRTCQVRSKHVMGITYYLSSISIIVTIKSALNP